jgi:hypothetical protein
MLLQFADLSYGTKESWPEDELRDIRGTIIFHITNLTIWVV